MLKIAFIGAGSFVFGENVLTDILTLPSLIEDTTICLEDIDAHYLDLMYRYMVKLKENYPEKFEGVSFEKTTNQRKAIEGAKYIINAIHVGGYEAYKLDMDIPYKYNVTQCVGDTLGPGGVFRFLRNAHVMKSILKDIEEVGYNSGKDGDKPLLLNYTNPMVMVTWYCNRIMPDSTVGLCHGVFGTALGLRHALGLKEENFSYLCAGINHMAWFIELLYRENKSSPWKNAYPLLNKKLEENPRFEEAERLRVDMGRATGYFMTESSGHLSEYLPYYRKREDLLEKYRGTMIFANLEHNFNYLMSKRNSESVDKKIARKLKRKKLKLKKRHSGEYASYIMNAIETNKPFMFNGNVINKHGGLITNLPKECCVEVPVAADSQGLHPQGGIELPTVCQALCISNIMVQKAAVEGALELDKEKIYHAVLLDPNTASVCSPREVRDMVEEMFEAESNWLPQFK
ncbi:MAG: alpha-glucosidase/alpha-galactosidase [Promethearchaeota archaeon]|nr:MAG: alpha-glucosidase/alpha-galactosidase [Candidatus Lokiarchaeota archaeon]